MKYIWVVTNSLWQTVPTVERFVHLRSTKATHVVQLYGREHVIRFANDRKFFFDEAEMREHIRATCEKSARCRMAEAKEAAAFAGSPKIRLVPHNEPQQRVTAKDVLKAKD